MKLSNLSLITSLLLGSSTLSALEFGQMGNISAGIGGAGVALKNSQWALYYNPALLAMNKKSGFAYSFGVGYKETNLSRAASVDIDNLQSMPDKLANLFNEVTRTSRAATQTKAFTPDKLGVFGDVLQNMGMKDEESMKKYLTDVANKNGVTIDSNTQQSPDKILEELKKHPEAFDTVKQDLLSTQNGIVVNIGSKGKRGTIGFGIMPSAYMSATARMDPTHNQIIIKNNNNEFKVQFDDGNIVLNTGTSGDFDKYSILSAQAKHQLHANSVGIVEVPLGYGHLFATPLGDIAVGLVAKYIFGTGYLYNKEGDFSSISHNLTPTFDGIAQTHTFGIDAGLAYSPRFAKNLTLGFVAKNLNMPKIKTDLKSGAMTKLNTQLRAGVSYGWLNDKIVLAGDIDLMPNDTISLARPKSQVAGGGVLIDLKYFDLRLGAMYDFRNNSDEGMILTGGINLLGFLDIAVQSNLHLSQEIAKTGIAVPSYLLVKVGGSFSW